MFNTTTISSVLRYLNRQVRKQTRLIRYQKRNYADAQGCTSCTISDSMVDPNKPEPSIVIIGAGMAGLSAAHRLSQCGINNYTILEATERPGGRIHSCWLGDVIAELGSHVIEGACVANPVYTLAAQEGLLKAPLPREKTMALFCTSEGRVVDPTIAMMAYHTFCQIKEEAMSLFSMSCGKEHGSLQNFFNLRIQQELQRFGEEQRYDASRIMYGLTTMIKTRLGDDLNQASANNFGSTIKIPGGEVRIPLGFVGVLAPLMKEMPECSIKFNKPVSSIKWGAMQGKGIAPKVVVQCCDGSEYCGDYALVTVSLGVLKEHGDKLFCPCLPCYKVEAIRNLGYGIVDKIYLTYDRPFWTWHDNTKFHWSHDELKTRKDWTKGLSSIEEVEGSNNILCAYVMGPEAALMEQITDEDVAETLTKLLRSHTGSETIPYPTSLLRSKWATDPYFCGSHSYISKNSHAGHLCDLGSPVPSVADPTPPVLLFAGEATTNAHPSTVHGARLSGIREAERIIRLTKKFGGPPPA